MGATITMAPSPSPGLIRAFLSISRLRSCASKSSLLRLQEPPPGLRLSSPWQCMLQRSFSAGRNGGEDEGGDLFGRKLFQNGAGSESRFGHGGPQNGRGDDEEPRLFGEGGLFGKSASAEDRPPTDDWDEQDDDASSFIPKQQDFEGFEYVEGEYEGQAWRETTAAAQAQPTVEEYIPGYPMQSEEAWSAAVSEEGLPAEHSADVAGDGQYEWMSTEQRGPSYIGKWGPDGRLLKFQPEPTQEFDPYPPVEGDATSPQFPLGAATSPDAAFGDLIRKKGYTDDDIANLLAGFYEPAGLPHLDDYKYVDIDAEKKEKRREMELEKMAEMAKRWVRKVDAQGFAHAVGRRKTSSARVWIKEGQGRIVINKKHHDMYFVSMDERVKYLEPFVITDTLGMFDTFVLVRGGGTTGQAGAIRLGVSRALMWYEPSLRGTLKKAGMLTRDPRMVERKKPGKAKARKSFQWVKR